MKIEVKNCLTCPLEYGGYCGAILGEDVHNNTSSKWKDAKIIYDENQMLLTKSCPRPILSQKIK